MDVPELVPLLDVHAEVVEGFAEREVGAVMGMGGQAEIVRGMVIGTVLGEELLGALRLLAQRGVTLELLDPDAANPPPTSA